MRQNLSAAIGMLLVCVALLVPVRVSADHDLTCHAPPPDPGPVHDEFHMMFGHITFELVEVRGAVRIALDRSGTTTADARVVVSTGDGRDKVSLVSDSATASCSSEGLVGLILSLQSRETGEVARLTVTSLAGPLNTNGRHEVHLILEYAAGTLEMDGAILVVSALDGPMP